MELDINNKYDSNAIKILNSNDEMCGFVPKKYKIVGNSDGNEEEIILNVLLKKKFSKLTKKYDLKVNEIYKWNGPTGLEVRFEKK